MHLKILANLVLLDKLVDYMRRCACGFKRCNVISIDADFTRITAASPQRGRLD
jgi:hypothetical protein